MPTESKANLKKRCDKISKILKKIYPQARTALRFCDPLQLLVATILSAQCTDVRVNIVTKELFSKYKSVKNFAAISQKQLEDKIRSTGFYRNKAKSIRGSAAKILKDFAGKVPQTMDELLTLPGVARKTANVVLGSAFGRNEGIVVDTHVSRVSTRLKLSNNKKTNAVRIEQDLMELVPRKHWTLFAHLLINHGRATCTARKPNCAECPINKLCPSAFKV